MGTGLLAATITSSHIIAHPCSIGRRKTDGVIVLFRIGAPNLATGTMLDLHHVQHGE